MFWKEWKTKKKVSDYYFSSYGEISPSHPLSPLSPLTWRLTSTFYAFNMINHTKLISVLILSLLFINTKHWLSAYLKGRLVNYRYNFTFSPYYHAKIGVYRLYNDSCTSPASFNFFVSTLPQFANSCVDDFSDSNVQTPPFLKWLISSPAMHQVLSVGHGWTGIIHICSKIHHHPFHSSNRTIIHWSSRYPKQLSAVSGKETPHTGTYFRHPLHFLVLLYPHLFCHNLSLIPDQHSQSLYWHQLGSTNGRYPYYLWISYPIPFHLCRFHLSIRRETLSVWAEKWI